MATTMQNAGESDRPMSLSVRIEKHKCQGFGACVKTLPGVFSLDGEGLVQFNGCGSASDEALLIAARRCPYKAILVVNEEAGEQLHPRMRPAAKPR